uniref:Uncharacterized protein n=1 Tax=Trepomonas sp. PC1 TaxID=1076344 RepID=A0A146JXU6_9EUKA|eukprot:JAP89523.1 Hypothetical protein TPC1_30982 [Trepomonas sp. PC1]
MKKEHLQLQAAHQQLEKAFELKKVEFDALNDQLQQQQRHQKEIQDRLNQAILDLQKKEIENRLSQQENEFQLTQIADKQNAFQQIINQLNQQEEEFNSKKEAFFSEQTQFQREIEQFKNSKAEFQQKQTQLDKLNAFQKQIEEQHQESVLQKSQIDFQANLIQNLQNEKQILNGQNGELEVENQINREKLNQKDKQIEQLQEQMKKLQEQISQQVDKNEFAFNEDLKTKTEDNQFLIQQIKNLKGQIKDYEVEIGKLKTQSVQSHGQKENLNFNACCQKLMQAEDVYSKTLKFSRETMQKNIQMQIYLEKRENEVEQLMNELIKTQRENKNLKTENEKIDEMFNKLNDIDKNEFIDPELAKTVDETSLSRYVQHVEVE